jgi:hypothetical protein
LRSVADKEAGPGGIDNNQSSTSCVAVSISGALDDRLWRRRFVWGTVARADTRARIICSKMKCSVRTERVQGLVEARIGNRYCVSGEGGARRKAAAMVARLLVESCTTRDLDG